MPFQIGKAQVLIEGSDVSIIACGHLVWRALQAAEELEKNGVKAEVISFKHLPGHKTGLDILFRLFL